MVAPKRRVAADTTGPMSKKTRITANERTRTAGTIFPVFNLYEWIEKRRLDKDVSVVQNRYNSGRRAVKKVVRMERDENGQRQHHIEIDTLFLLQGCDRIVQMMSYVDDMPALDLSTVVFHYYPEGDLDCWKREHFGKKNDKPVPESYIWRFFVQMAQAVAFIHGVVGPGIEDRKPIIHRDIKPKNILVCYNGTTYPTFKLHDFGCGTFHSAGKELRDSFCGTFEFQPPETPRINTFAADIWSVGACVHWLCVGRPPIKSVVDYTVSQKRRNNGQHPKAAFRGYTAPEQYYRAHVPRKVLPINLTPEEQQEENIPTKSARGHNPQYSDSLNRWLRKTCHMRTVYRATHYELLWEMIPLAQEMLRQSTGGAGLADLDFFDY